MVRFLIFFFSVWVFCMSSWAMMTVQTDYTKATITTDHKIISKETKQIWVLLTLDLKKGYHSYWRNPGDSGLETTIDITAPQGIIAKPILWQAPNRYPYAGMVNYGYEDKAYHLVPLEIDHAALQKNDISLKIEASWLICKDLCIPENASFDMPILRSEHAHQSDHYDSIQQWVRAAQYEILPVQSVNLSPDYYSFFFDHSAFKTPPKKLYFYADQAGIVQASAPQIIDNKEKESVFSLILKKDLTDIPNKISGLLESQTESGKEYYRLSIDMDKAAMTTDNNPILPKPSDPHVKNLETFPNKTDFFLGTLLFFAFLGGLILNAMPCVFPILSLKALSVVQKAHSKPHIIRFQGLAYTAGVLLSFILIGIILLIIKSTGSAIGWGFQMQSPLFVTSLLYLMFMIGLNLSGFLDINWVFGGGHHLASKENYLGSFMTGVLSVVVATPCSAPFMATALGATLTLSSIPALLIFTFLGLGLAFPFLIICFVPALTRFLPKPGAWMETLRNILAFPIYATAIWLLWVVGLQTHIDYVALCLVGLLGLVLLLSIRNIKSMMGKIILFIIAFMLIASPFYTLNNYKNTHDTNLSISKETAFSFETLKEKRDAGKDVFVYATASWCITCHLNEQTVLSRDLFKQTVKDHNITVLKADWTSSDKVITRFLKQYGRAGVPFYIYYPANKEAVILPQILNLEEVITTLTLR